MQANKRIQIIRNCQGEPLLFEGKKMTWQDFKMNVGRIDKPWIEYMRSVLRMHSEGKLYREE